MFPFYLIPTSFEGIYIQYKINRKYINYCKMKWVEIHVLK